MFVYFIGAIDNRRGTLESVKIGKANNPFKRLCEIQTSTPLDLVMMGYCAYDSEDLAVEAEKKYHQKFKRLRLRGEWFKVSKELLEEICQFEVKKEDFREIEASEPQESVSETHSEIIFHLKEAGDHGLSAGDLENLTGKPNGTVRTALRRMLSKGIIYQPRKRGKYYCNV